MSKYLQDPDYLFSILTILDARQPSHMQTNESIVKTWKGFIGR
jgi:hypothetical protein